MSPRLAVVAHAEKLGSKDASALRSCLAQRGFRQMSWTTVPKGSAATKAVESALDAGADRVLVAGGDGTVRAGIQALAGTDVPLAVLPAGTANLFAGALGLPSTPEDVATAVWAAETRRIDTAKCNKLAFAVMAGTGFDAAMIDGADDAKDRLGMLAYVKAGVTAVRDDDAFCVTVEVDGAPFYTGPASCVLIGNLGELKGGISAFPESDPSDGLLEVGVVTADGARQWVGLLTDVVRRRQRQSSHAHTTQGTKIDVRLDHKERFELDGGSKGKSKKLKFRVVPDSLSVCLMPR